MPPLPAAPLSDREKEIILRWSTTNPAPVSRRAGYSSKPRSFFFALSVFLTTVFVALAGTRRASSCALARA